MNFGNHLDDVHRVVLHVEVGCFGGTCPHRVEFCLDVRGEDARGEGHIGKTYSTLAGVDDGSRIFARLELAEDGVHLVVEGLLVGSTCRHVHVDILDVAHFVVEAEQFFVLVIGGLEVAVFDLDLLVGNRSERQSRHLCVGGDGAVVESHFSAHRVAGEGSHEERLILVHEQLAAQLLLGVDLLSHRGIDLFALHFLGLLEETLEGGVVEATVLPHKHRNVLETLGRSFAKGLFHLFVGDDKAELVALVLDEFKRNKLIPHLVAHLLRLFVGEAATAAELLHFGGFVDHLVEFLLRKALAVDLTHGAAAAGDGRDGVLVEYHGQDEEEKSYSHDCNNPRIASDFL